MSYGKIMQEWTKSLCLNDPTFSDRQSLVNSLAGYNGNCVIPLCLLSISSTLTLSTPICLLMFFFLKSSIRYKMSITFLEMYITKLY